MHNISHFLCLSGIPSSRAVRSGSAGTAGGGSPAGGCRFLMGFPPLRARGSGDSSRPSLTILGARGRKREGAIRALLENKPPRLGGSGSSKRRLLPRVWHQPGGQKKWVVAMATPRSPWGCCHPGRWRHVGLVAAPGAGASPLARLREGWLLFLYIY